MTIAWGCEGIGLEAARRTIYKILTKKYKILLHTHVHVRILQKVLGGASIWVTREFRQTEYISWLCRCSPLVWSIAPQTYLHEPEKHVLNAMYRVTRWSG